MYLTSGYHQIPLDEESQNLLCSASDIFNFLTDGEMRYDGSEAIKNMDDILLHGQTLEELEKKLKAFMKYCEEKNLKLKPSKMVISEEVEFAGTAIRAEKKNDMMLFTSCPGTNVYRHSWN